MSKIQGARAANAGAPAKRLRQIAHAVLLMAHLKISHRLAPQRLRAQARTTAPFKSIQRERSMSKRLLATACAILLCSSAVAQEKSTGPIKIGVIADMSGIYQGNSGKGATVAVQLAVEDVGGKVLGRPIEVMTADHQDKPDVASGIARRWYDQEG